MFWVVCVTSKLKLSGKGHSTLRLSGNGNECKPLLFGLPIVLDTACEDTAVGDKVLLQYQGKDVGVLTVESKWLPNKPKEAGAHTRPLFVSTLSRF